MNTPTDDEIVAHLKQTYTGGVFLDEAIREALRLAREGLPVPVDEATLLVREVMHAYQDAKPETRPDGGNMRWRKGSYDNLESTVVAIDAARTFLAKRDAERDAEVKELVKAAKAVKDNYSALFDVAAVSAALAKMERKP